MRQNETLFHPVSLPTRRLSPNAIAEWAHFLRNELECGAIWRRFKTGGMPSVPKQRHAAALPKHRSRPVIWVSLKNGHTQKGRKPVGVCTFLAVGVNLGGWFYMVLPALGETTAGTGTSAALREWCLKPFSREKGIVRRPTKFRPQIVGLADEGVGSFRIDEHFQ